MILWSKCVISWNLQVETSSLLWWGSEVWHLKGDQIMASKHLSEITLIIQSWERMPNPSNVRWHHRKIPYFILKTVPHLMLCTSCLSLLYIFQLFKEFWYMNSAFLHSFCPFLTLEISTIHLQTHSQIYDLFNCDVNEVLLYEVLVYEVINNKWMVHMHAYINAVWWFPLMLLICIFV